MLMLQSIYQYLTNTDFAYFQKRALPPASTCYLINVASAILNHEALDDFFLMVAPNGHC